jgi:hypothetical protein
MSTWGQVGRLRRESCSTTPLFALSAKHSYAACKELPYIEQSELIRESMARKIIGAAASGERDVLRLRDAALSVWKSVLH